MMVVERWGKHGMETISNEQYERETREAAPAPAEKMTAERLIKIADEAGAIYKDSFIAAYVAATRTCLEAFKQAKDEGMAEEIAAIALQRLQKNADLATQELDAALTALGEEFGLE